MIIGIHGRAQSGKDTLGLFIEQELTKEGYHCRLVSFADPVKQLLMYMFNLSHEHLYTEMGKSSRPPSLGGASVREMLVKVGQGLRILLGANLWVSRLCNQLNNLDTVYIVTDVRDAMEYGALLNKNAYQIKLKRHISSSADSVEEALLPDNCFCKVIDNQDMTREEFLATCNQIVSEILDELT
jgi:hypothetical protein